MDPFEYLETRGMFNIDPGLERMEKIMRSLKDPHLSIPSVHIGGTNGKGSTSVIVEAILGEFPLRTGMYTSPHLISVLERLRIDKKDIDRETLGRAMSRVLAVGMREELTYFELLTAASYLVMEEIKVDINISEVGMGGRLDATNVLEPQAIAITSISMDHMEHLGYDPVSITSEKCGVIKTSTPVVVGEVCNHLQEGERCLRTILDRCTQNGCPVILVSKKADVERKKELLSSYRVPDWRIVSVDPQIGPSGTRATLDVAGFARGGQKEPKFALIDEVLRHDYELPLVGVHQAYNMAIGICLSLLVLPFALYHSRLREGDAGVISSFISGGIEGVVKEYPSANLREMVQTGLKKVSIPGRMEVFRHDGRELFVDGGHNIEAARSIGSALRSIHPERKVVLLMAMMGDKEVAGFLRNLKVEVASIILTTMPYDRAMPPEDLLNGVVRSGLDSEEVHIRPDIGTAVDQWLDLVYDDKIGLATGSFYLYRFVKEHLEVQKDRSDLSFC
ncbi:MAG: hypothetical protein JXA22_10840 [Candidatus Thermoplasmatota archaeon]|nr:hypothetical protein [Candidatus Thermoplasmatota archaeon]